MNYPIQTLTGENFKKWKGDLDIALGMLDYDIALTDNAPPAPAENDTAEVRANREKWRKANKMAILLMKKSMNERIRGGIADSDSAKTYLASIEAKFKESEKAEVGVLMKTLMTSRYNGDKNIREHIMGLVDVGAKLNSLEVTIGDKFIVHAALNSLPDEYSSLKSSYNAQKESWTMDELIAICVQEEQEIKKKRQGRSVNYVHNNKVAKPNPKVNDKPGPSKFNANYRVNKPIGIRCFFCKKFGHAKKECNRYKRWHGWKNRRLKVSTILFQFVWNRML